MKRTLMDGTGSLIARSCRNLRPLVGLLMVGLALICDRCHAQMPRGESANPPPPTILVNHVGYRPQAGKYCVIAAHHATDFQVVRVHPRAVVLKGTLKPVHGDFGRYWVGDFSDLTEPGIYRVVAGTSQSERFRIAEDVYSFALRKMVGYFGYQRCGPSESGYNSPCHLDDGVRLDNGKRHDATGGWHDAGDVRKWVWATICGMLGLAELHNTLRPQWDHGQIYDELKWGNRYFLAMQDADGHIMDNCGGDILQHGDMNRWTDNIPGTGDDRLIQTKPAFISTHFNFVQVQMAMIQITQAKDPEYAQRCRRAAERCLDWLARQKVKKANDLGAGIDAYLRSYATLADDKYRDLAVDFARRLIALQVSNPLDPTEPVGGFFRTAEDDPRPDNQTWNGCWHLIALCNLVEALPGHADTGAWRKTIAAFAEDYLCQMASRTAFGIVPYGLYDTNELGEGRQIGKYRYSWFMRPDPDFWQEFHPSHPRAMSQGRNSSLAATGVGLVKASRVLNRPSLAKQAQRQLDWILGVNPFNASTVSGVGRNQPVHFMAMSAKLNPPTPQIPGAVMTGIGGTKNDDPQLESGEWYNCEYWTPCVAYTMWLMTELQRGGFQP